MAADEVEYLTATEILNRREQYKVFRKQEDEYFIDKWTKWILLTILKVELELLLKKKQNEDQQHQST